MSNIEYLTQLKKELEKAKERELEELSKISKMTVEQAKNEMMEKLHDDMKQEMACFIRSEQDKAKEIVDKKAKELLVSSMQKYSQDMANEHTVSTIELPNNEMKGRIIGREGRNIRTIE